VKSNTNLIWIDLEMTGLDVTKERIIEIATIVTDSELTTLAEGPSLVIHQDDDLLQNMDAWNTKQHNKTGLLSRVKASQINEPAAEKSTLEFLEKYIDAKLSPMCGNTVSHDRLFLKAYMPKLESFFHYRHVDISTIKELARRWAPKVFEGFKKESKHLALDDIKDSIDELRYYREHFIKQTES